MCASAGSIGSVGAGRIESYHTPGKNFRLKFARRKGIRIGAPRCTADAVNLIRRRKGEWMFVQLVAIVVLAGFAGLAPAEDRPVLKTDKDKVSYSIGLDIGTNFKRQSVDLDQKALAAGIAGGRSGGGAGRGRGGG